MFLDCLAALLHGRCDIKCAKRSEITHKESERHRTNRYLYIGSILRLVNQVVQKGQPLKGTTDEQGELSFLHAELHSDRSNSQRGDEDSKPLLQRNTPSNLKEIQSAHGEILILTMETSLVGIIASQNLGLVERGWRKVYTVCRRMTLPNGARRLPVEAQRTGWEGADGGN